MQEIRVAVATRFYGLILTHLSGLLLTSAFLIFLPICFCSPLHVGDVKKIPMTDGCLSSGFVDFTARRQFRKCVRLNLAGYALLLSVTVIFALFVALFVALFGAILAVFLRTVLALLRAVLSIFHGAILTLLRTILAVFLTLLPGKGIPCLAFCSNA